MPRRSELRCASWHSQQVEVHADIPPRGSQTFMIQEAGMEMPPVEREERRSGAFRSLAEVLPSLRGRCRVQASACSSVAARRRAVEEKRSNVRFDDEYLERRVRRHRVPRSGAAKWYRSENVYAAPE